MVKKEQKMGDKVIPVKVAVRVRPLVPKEVRKEKKHFVPEYKILRGSELNVILVAVQGEGGMPTCPRGS